MYQVGSNATQVLPLCEITSLKCKKQDLLGLGVKYLNI